jgi:membrane-associated phospholipid phosphatase
MPAPGAEGTTVKLQSKLQSWGRRGSLVVFAALTIHPLAATAQTVTLPAPRNQPGVIHWWDGAIVLGGLSGLMLLDKPAQRFSQDNRSQTGNDLARGLRRFGQPEVYGTITLGLLGTGLISGNDEITRAGGRLATTLALAGATSTLAKLALGRPRPSESLDADGYVPFSGQEAMPSGHTTMAFALATALADDIHRTWATVGLYTVATGVAWSRVNDNRHWLSDVAAGAVIGVTSAKLVSGHWRIFNLRTPRFLIGPGNATVAWNWTF